MMWGKRTWIYGGLFALWAVLGSDLARAYNDEVTHPALSHEAANKSHIGIDVGFLPRLGLPQGNNMSFGYRPSRHRNPEGRYTIAQLIGEGAFDEDNWLRALNHFYDPVRYRPLTVLGVPQGKSSVEWMLEWVGPIFLQDRSLADAKNYFYEALTFNDGSPQASDAERGKNWGLLFLSLGAAVHHMQDMAQPQHVRNDQHCDAWVCYRIYIDNKSLYEEYTAKRATAVNALAASASPMYPGTEHFTKLLHFWLSANEVHPGIATFTNRHFVSQGTNFTLDGDQVNTGTYPEPRPGGSRDYTIDELYAAAGDPVPLGTAALCDDPGVACTVTMYSTALSEKASSLSIFDQDLVANGVSVSYTNSAMGPGYTTERLFALNRFNFDDAHKTLIPQAVAYSAGLINFFFRGSLQINPPALGAYAVADHATAQGFNTIKAKIKNTTPNEAMDGGMLVAIAKFHRNGCYQADLSGEFTTDAAGNLVEPCPDYRSAEEYIVTSAEQTLTLASGEQREISFTFDGYIPMDATDLYLQVVYRGILGDESDGIAVGTVDLAEPTFLAVMNATDVFYLQDTFYYYDHIIDNISRSPYSIIDSDRNGTFNVPPDLDVRGGTIDYEVSLDGGRIATIEALPEGRFARLALLLDPPAFNFSLASNGAGFNRVTSYQMSAKTAQIRYSNDSGAAVYFVAPVARLRNHSLQWNRVTSVRYYAVVSPDLDTIPPSNAAEAEVPVPIQISQQDTP